METEPKLAELPVPTTVEGKRELLRRAAKGDTATVPALRALLAKPGNIDQLGGNLARHAQRAFIEALNNQDLAVQEAIAAKIDALRRELLGDHPTPVEHLLVERVVACWLQVQDAEIRYAKGQGTFALKQGEYHQRRMDAANKRFLAAVKALALVRKLAVPVLQVNIAKRQVNVAAPTAVTVGTKG